MSTRTIVDGNVVSQSRTKTLQEVEAEKAAAATPPPLPAEKVPSDIPSDKRK
jgi:hypothetical protein